MDIYNTHLSDVLFGSGGDVLPNGGDGDDSVGCWRGSYMQYVILMCNVVGAVSLLIDTRLFGSNPPQTPDSPNPPSPTQSEPSPPHNVPVAASTILLYLDGVKYLVYLSPNVPTNRYTVFYTSSIFLYFFFTASWYQKSVLAVDKGESEALEDWTMWCLGDGGGCIGRYWLSFTVAMWHICTRMVTNGGICAGGIIALCRLYEKLFKNYRGEFYSGLIFQTYLSG